MPKRPRRSPAGSARTCSSTRSRSASARRRIGAFCQHWGKAEGLVVRRRFSIMSNFYPRRTGRRRFGHSRPSTGSAPRGTPTENTAVIANGSTLQQAGLRAWKIWAAAFPESCLQWHHDGPALPYRCGGSAGFSPASRFIRVFVRGHLLHPGPIACVECRGRNGGATAAASVLAGAAVKHQFLHRLAAD